MFIHPVVQSVIDDTRDATSFAEIVLRRSQQNMHRLRQFHVRQRGITICSPPSIRIDTDFKTTGTLHTPSRGNPSCHTCSLRHAWFLWQINTQRELFQEHHFDNWSSILYRSTRYCSTTLWSIMCKSALVIWQIHPLVSTCQTRNQRRFLICVLLTWEQTQSMVEVEKASEE